MLKKILLGLAAVLGVVVLGAGGFVFAQVSAFNSSLEKVYDIPLPTIALSSDPAVLERGKHIADSFGACHGCHGANLAGGKSEDMGPLGKITYPNITKGAGGRGAEYSDAELARLIKHGVRKNGTTARFMPSHEMSWWPEDDVVAVISYVRSLPPVDGQPAVLELSPLAKVLDRLDKIPLDVARRIDHAAASAKSTAPAPGPTKEYGALLAISCHGCHGEHLSGGRIPGAPDTLPIPRNLTPDASGLKDYSVDDFKATLRTGVRKNGQKLDPFMPIEATKNMTDVELEALYAYLRSVPPMAAGNR